MSAVARQAWSKALMLYLQTSMVSLPTRYPYQCNVQGALSSSVSTGNLDYTRPKITDMTPVAESPHNKYGSAVFIRKDLKEQYICIHS